MCMALLCFSTWFDGHQRRGLLRPLDALVRLLRLPVTGKQKSSKIGAIPPGPMYPSTLFPDPAPKFVSQQNHKPCDT
jgi:hypothetical protein